VLGNYNHYHKYGNNNYDSQTFIIRLIIDSHNNNNNWNNDNDYDIYVPDRLRKLVLSKHRPIDSFAATVDCDNVAAAGIHCNSYFVITDNGHRDLLHNIEC